MKILLLHPDDDIHGSWARTDWDTVVDLGRAPQSLYDQWSAEFQCPVVSIFDFAREVEDLWLWDGLLRLGLGRIVDRFGIDWWDVIGPVLQSQLQDVRLTTMLARKLGSCKKLTVSQPSLLADAISLQLKCPLQVLQAGRSNRARRAVGRYRRALTSLSLNHLRQVVYDKYDPHYRFRKKLAWRAQPSSLPVVLLPSAYSNVTKTALSYAKILPDQEFLLVLARESAAVLSIPKNVQTETLAVFAGEPRDEDELRQLEKSWDELEQSLCGQPDFSVAIELGILKDAKRWLRWGMVVRDAWRQVFEKRPIIGCLSADDTNPYTRIPLLLALQNGIPGIACHHGALDGRMAFKSHRFTKYLAKGEMEQDYLTRICRVDPAKIKTGSASAPADRQSLWNEDSPSIVFFSEPYETDSWRVEAMYRELVPRLVAVARAAGKSVVIKLHPFESLRQRTRLMKSVLAAEDQQLVSLIDEPFSQEILKKTWCAVTVESTVAFECAAVGIPVFLCGWLRHACSGYAGQYARFGVGRMMQAPGDLLSIPDTLRNAIPAGDVAQRLVQPITAQALAELLCGAPGPV